MDQIVIVYALFGPFLLWPVEYLLPYPYIVEELFKLILVWFFPKNTAKEFVYAGIAFAATETVFYSLNVNAFGSIGLLLTRFVLTAILHSFTFLVLYWFNKIDKRLTVLGFILAVSIHFLYNRYITSYL